MDALGRFCFTPMRSSQAAVPYFDMLEQWIYKGIIQDPYSELLVEESAGQF